ncbi:unnamed protein product [Staurois parvus]|uniref:Uncharacterized protein n=1 Tax=Staurois parvus TaxID=386267 RepID=A0ABN9CSY4_9NEOB|nr:unnamed protein product [Staurois parvus]
MRGSGSAQHGDALCPPDTADHRSTERCRLGHVISCVKSQLIADDKCALMISVAPAVLPVSVHQCQLTVLISATCQCPSVPHQCHISVPISSHQCHISVPI